VSVTIFLPDQYVTRGDLCNSSNLRFMLCSLTHTWVGFTRETISRSHAILYLITVHLI